QDSLSVANRPSIHMTKRCTYYLNSRCSPLIKNDSTGQYINGNDASVVGAAVELTIHYSSVPQVFVVPASPTFDLGRCQTGGNLEKSLPVDIYFIGNNVTGGLNTKVSWIFTRDTHNPDSSAPQVKLHGSLVTSSVSTIFTQTASDAGLSLLFACRVPGSYIWTMNLTATPP
ncbi:hypothetical protein, partial [Erwinia sp. V71]|uniref:hypothetical protein n=1 Tax=Erwinia sp. V71 TaxID=3369424 RepID=UPI003F5FE429